MRIRAVCAIGGVLVGLLAFALLAGGCVERSRGLPTPTPWPTLVTPDKPLYTVATGTVTDSFKLSGQVVPSKSARLAFTVDGRLATLSVTVGSDVAEGDILAELEMQDLKEQLAQARLTLEQAEEQLAEDSATRAHALARAQLNLEREQLRLEALRRDTQLRTPLERTQAETQLEQARIRLQQAQAAYDRAAGRPGIEAAPEAMALQNATLEFQLAEIRYKLATLASSDDIALQEIQVRLQELEVQQYSAPDTAGLERKVTSATIQVEGLERRIEERRLRAPFGGIVIAVGVEVQGYGGRGTISTRPETGTPISAFAPLIVLAKQEGLEINVSADAQRVAELAVGMPVTVTHPLARNAPFASQVTEIPVKAPDGAAPTGAQVVRIALPPGQVAATIGDFVEVLVVKTVHVDALYVPPAALRAFGGRTFVVVQEGEKQRRVDVSVGLRNDRQVEILSGLKPGDVLVGE
jgi:multidrug efflux pump subunit AcrA (membrane-fusion protein)